MAICAVFSLSSDPAELIGAGLGLVTGAVLMGAALISASVVVASPNSPPPSEGD